MPTEKLIKPSRQTILDAWEQSKQKSYVGNPNWHEGRGGKLITKGSTLRTASILGVSGTTARKWLIQEGVLGVTPSYRKDINKLLDLYTQQNKTIRECARIMNMSESQVSRWLKKAGVDIIKSQYRRNDLDNQLINKKISNTKSAPEFQEMLIKQNIEKFGRSHPQQIHLSDEIYNLLNSRELLLNFINTTHIRTILGLAKSIGVSENTIKRSLTKFDLMDRIDVFTSYGESELQQILESWNIKAGKAKKILDNYEIDLLIKDKKIGLEFNGDYWHSENFKKNRYHYNKSILAESKGIFLYHIFEYEWNDPRKRTAIIGQLKNLLVGATRVLDARQCELKLVDDIDKKIFLEDNHVQGDDRSAHRYGLFYKGELVQIMTFGKPRYDNTKEYEIHRMCTKIDVQVRGGFSRLFKHFVDDFQPETIISYSDIAKTKGDIYTTLGFTLSHVSEPGYVWTNGKNILSRYKTRIKNEVNAMKDKGYYRIYDCGNKVYIWENPNKTKIKS